MPPSLTQAVLAPDRWPGAVAMTAGGGHAAAARPAAVAPRGPRAPSPVHALRPRPEGDAHSLVAPPLVDGVRLAQRALGGWNAVGDASVALAQTPQLAADLLRAKAPAQARPPPSSLWQPARQAATRSLPPSSGAPALLCGVSRSLLESSCGAWPETASLPRGPHLSNVRVCHQLPYALSPLFH